MGKLNKMGEFDNLIDVQTSQDESLRVMTKENMYNPRWSKFSPPTVEGVIDDYLEEEYLLPYVHNAPGVVFLGEMFDQLRHGFGQLVMFNEILGRIVLYEGTFLCGAIHSGNAKLYNEKGDLEYSGEVFMGKKVKGKEFHYNGALRYEGDFRCEKPHGKDCILYDIHGKIDFQGEINYGEPKRKFDYNEWKKKKARERANEIFKMQKRLRF